MTIYSHVVDNQDLMGSSESQYFVQTLEFTSKIRSISADSATGNQIGKSVSGAVVSMMYSKSTDMIFISYESGLILFGRPILESNGSLVLEDPTRIDAEKAASGSVSSVLLNNLEPWLRSTFSRLWHS